MNMAKAYDDFQVSIACGMSRRESLDHACACWGVKESDLLTYIATFA
jgi:hypothetical protein